MRKNKQLNIALVQYDIHWENPMKNASYLDRFLNEDNKFDFLVLPEMFNTGFSMDVSKNAQSMDGNTMQWLIASAKQYNLVIAGSLIIKEKNDFFNRCVFVFPEGHIKYYDKKHLFTYGKENLSFKAGSERLIVEVKGWKICPLICYDLRFPVWSRFKDDYEVLLYVANWPTPRANAWNTLLQARAIENQSYVIGVNRIGMDNNQLNYQGDSQIIDFTGNVIRHLSNEAGLQHITISKEPLYEFRNKFKFLQDRDSFCLDSSEQ